MLKPVIKATRTTTHIEFREFPPDCGWFDPIDDLMFLPLNVPNMPSDVPDSLSPEYILLKIIAGVQEEVYDKGYHNEFYGVRWDMRPFKDHGKKVAWTIYQYVKELFAPDCEVVLVEG
jgi:hypothetical protein